MKRVFTILTMITVSLSLTSCWEFKRQQKMKDAEAHGKAELLEAEHSKQVQIEDAKGLAEASELQAKAKVNIAKAEAQAEIERAHGVAKANEIIGKSLEGNKEYLEYLKIQAIQGRAGDRIYIPTEAMMPITEAK